MTIRNIGVLFSLSVAALAIAAERRAGANAGRHCRAGCDADRHAPRRGRADLRMQDRRRRQACLGVPRTDRDVDPGGKTVGRHYAGPNWEYADGSIVQAKAAGNAPGATANDVPWLKLDVVGHRGAGTFAGADIVQRINTSGGVLRGPCEQAGALRSAPYSADYVFLRKGG